MLLQYTPGGGGNEKQAPGMGASMESSGMGLKMPTFFFLKYGGFNTLPPPPPPSPTPRLRRPCNSQFLKLFEDVAAGTLSNKSHKKPQVKTGTTETILKL